MAIESKILPPEFLIEKPGDYSQLYACNLVLDNLGDQKHPQLHLSFKPTGGGYNVDGFTLVPNAHTIAGYQDMWQAFETVKTNQRFLDHVVAGLRVGQKTIEDDLARALGKGWKEHRSMSGLKFLISPDSVEVRRTDSGHNAYPVDQCRLTLTAYSF
jgi:hypothetical protein